MAKDHVTGARSVEQTQLMDVYLANVPVRVQIAES
jgi:hypothetical protein